MQTQNFSFPFYIFQAKFSCSTLHFQLTEFASPLDYALQCCINCNWQNIKWSNRSESISSMESCLPLKVYLTSNLKQAAACTCFLKGLRVSVQTNTYTQADNMSALL